MISSLTRILGPKCFLPNHPIPTGTEPILNTAMQDVVACLTGFYPEDKDIYQQMIRYIYLEIVLESINKVFHHFCSI